MYNVNAVLALQYAYKFIDVLRAYFGQVNEEKVKDNFVLTYELLDECMDFGWPQLTAVALLSSFIHNGEAKSEATAASQDSGITSEITGSVDWRQPGQIQTFCSSLSDLTVALSPLGKYRYKKNEVFIDVVESVNMLCNQEGQVVKSDVSGQVMMRTQLTGMPECHFGLNDRLAVDRDAKRARPQANGARAPVSMDDVTFHRCVKLNRFAEERTISFIPPDGEFELMKYRIADGVVLPFTVTPIVTEQGRSRVEYEVKIKANFKAELFAQDLVIKLPTPPNVSDATCTPSVGKAKYKQQEKALVWKSVISVAFFGDGGNHSSLLIQDQKAQRWRILHLPR